MPGDVDAPPVRTHYSAPDPDAVRPPSMPPPEPTPHPSSHPRLSIPGEPPPRARWLFVLGCFVLGAAIAALVAWKTGRLGGSDDAEERFVARATDAMFKNHFHEPPGDNVKDITDEGLKRWPNDRKLLDVRVRAANELSTQAIAQRSAGDVLEALRLARLAHELDPNDASAKRLVEQYEGELASFSPSAAPTLTPPHPSAPKPPGPGPGPSAAATAAQPGRIDYKVLLDVSSATPKIGQPVELSARIAPNKGDFTDPGFTVYGPGVISGVRVPAAAVAPGVFKTTYVFIEAGKYDVTFATQVDGNAITAKRTVSTAGAPAPTPPPTAPTPTPPPTGSVKWM